MTIKLNGILGYCILALSMGACSKDLKSTEEVVVASSKSKSMVQAISVHPGCLHTKADLDRMKSKKAAGTQPWLSGYTVLAAHANSKSAYTLQGPFATVDRGTTNTNRSAFENDANAAYQQALMWYIDANTVYRDKALSIIKAWTNANTTFTGKDKQLLVSLAGFKFVNAAEIMRYSNSGWAAADITKTENWFKNNFWPHIVGSGAPTGVLDGNWGTGSVKCQIAIAVFCNDQTRFNNALTQFRNTSCSVSGAGVSQTILVSGQCSESGRDQGHTQLSIGHLAETAEIAWNQGVDLYSEFDNRIRSGFEYSAKYNLGNAVGFQTFGTCKGTQWTSISTTDRGNLRPIYEMVWNHYEKRKGLVNFVGYTKQAAAQLRPEGAAFQADHPGFGTLLFTR